MVVEGGRRAGKGSAQKLKPKAQRSFELLNGRRFHNRKPSPFLCFCNTEIQRHRIRSLYTQPRAAVYEYSCRGAWLDRTSILLTQLPARRGDVHKAAIQENVAIFDPLEMDGDKQNAPVPVRDP